VGFEFGERAVDDGEFGHGRSGGWRD